MNQKITLGLFGFGCVGQGLYNVLQANQNLEITIKKIAVKNRDKTRSLDNSRFTFNKNEILNDPEINVIVELIDDAHEAFHIVSSALQKGKAVVSANKKMIAEHFSELYRLQQQYQAPLLYEASVCGSIPIIRTLEEYYANDQLHSLESICNGTTNYILTQTALAGKTYAEALGEAQALGFAETDPHLDVQAYDPKYKLSILLAHAFGIIVSPDQLLHYGIQHLHSRDSYFAREKGLRIRLLAHTHIVNNEVHAYVMPGFVNFSDPLYHVNDEYNAARLQGRFSDRQLLMGKGAGSLPTAAAVLSDIAALQYGYRYPYPKSRLKNRPRFSNDFSIRVYIRYSEEKILRELGLSDIEEHYNSAGYCYAIGSVRAEDLLAADLNNRNNLFIATLSA